MSDSTNEAERVLREGLRANALSPEALQRIRQATEQEWRSATHVPARRGWRALAAAASIAVVAAGLAWTYLSMNSGAAHEAVFGEIASFDAPGMIETGSMRRDVLLTQGSKLHVGLMFEAHGDSLISLSGGGNLRVARATVIEVVDENTVSLERGELYVDIPPGSHASDAFRVVTDAGEFHHQGTQFAVAIVEGQTRLRVREGQVLWRAIAGDSTVQAGTEVIIDRGGQAMHRPVATSGRDWAWMESMTPEVTIEDRPLIEFLDWYARETGRKLVIEAAAREQAASIRMHGDVRGLTVTEALSAVMATTSLRYELPEGVIRISSTRESKIPPA